VCVSDLKIYATIRLTADRQVLGKLSVKETTLVLQVGGQSVELITPSSEQNIYLQNPQILLAGRGQLRQTKPDSRSNMRQKVIPVQLISIIQFYLWFIAGCCQQTRLQYDILAGY
jgi:hypothetical protein